MSNPPLRRLACVAILILAANARADGPRDPAKAAEAEAFFAARIRPILTATCAKCHDARKARGGLRLDARAAALKGGDRGPALVPGEPDRSLLIQALRY